MSSSKCCVTMFNRSAYFLRRVFSCHIILRVKNVLLRVIRMMFAWGCLLGSRSEIWGHLPFYFETSVWSLINVNQVCILTIYTRLLCWRPHSIKRHRLACCVQATKFRIGNHLVNIIFHTWFRRIIVTNILFGRFGMHLLTLRFLINQNPIKIVIFNSRWDFLIRGFIC